MTCHIAKASIFLGELEHTRVSYVRVCMGSRVLNICRWVQSGPASCGVYNLGRIISSERDPALARCVDCMTSSLLSLREPSSVNHCVVWLLQRVVGSDGKKVILELTA